MASKSGLTGRDVLRPIAATASTIGDASSVPAGAVAPLGGATWSDVRRRQQRVLSAASVALERAQKLEDVLEQRLGWTGRVKPNTVQGAEWTALAARQQLLLQRICVTRERFKRVGYSLGFSSAPHEEAVAAPQLRRRVPSHFNNQQLRALLQLEPSGGIGPNGQVEPAMYPLSKLLLLVAVRDLQRFISSGANRGADESSILAAKEKEKAGADSTTAATASSTAAVSSSAAASAAAASPSPSPSPYPAELSQQNAPESFIPLPSLVSSEEDLSALSLAQLLQRLLWRICRVRIEGEPALAHAIREGSAMAAMSLQLDKDSRALFNEEPYVLPAADATVMPDNVTLSAAVNAARATFHARQARSWFGEGKSPFADFNFSKPPTNLSQARRVPCSQCSRPASLYCAFCLVPTLPKELQIRPVKLPVQVDIIHHVGENVKKSTSIHACILSPEHARFLEHPRDLPAEGYDPASTLLLYPTADAVHLDDARCIDARAVRRVIVIESTWGKSDAVAAHPLLANIRRVKIRQRESTFWRYQELGRHFLATLEAIFWLCKEIQQRRDEVAGGDGEASNLDDLMYFYAYQHGIITDRYKNNTNAPRSWSGGATLQNKGGVVEEEA